MIRDILVNLSTTQKHDRARDYAVSLAEKFDAQLTGIAFAYEAAIPVMSGAESLPVEYLEKQRAEYLKAAQTAKDKFLKSSSVIRCEALSPSTSLFGAANLFAKIGRHFDLCVVEQGGADTTAYDYIIEAALFDSGRPVLVVPYIQKTPPKFETSLICWDGTKPAARAVADSLPLLQRSKRIQVITVAERKKVTEEFPGAEIAQHLSRHGLKVETKRINVEDVNISEAILSHAADIGADFLVMGAYGHTRLREFILGGVTAEILSAMTVPALMSH